MSYIYVEAGQSMNLSAQLSDGEQSLPLIVKAVLRDSLGNQLNEITLNHAGGGLFINPLTTMPDFEYISVQYYVYYNDGLTLANYSVGLKEYKKGSLGNGSTKVNTIPQEVVVYVED